MAFLERGIAALKSTIALKQKQRREPVSMSKSKRESDKQSQTDIFRHRLTRRPTTGLLKGRPTLAEFSLSLTGIHALLRLPVLDKRLRYRLKTFIVTSVEAVGTKK